MPVIRKFDSKLKNMHRFLIFSFCSLLVFSAELKSQDNVLGVTWEPSFATKAFSNKTMESDPPQEYKYGFCFANSFSLDYIRAVSKRKNIGIKTGIAFPHRGYKLKYSFGDSTTVSKDRFRYIAIPVEYHQIFFNLMYIGGGLNVDYLIAGRRKAEDGSRTRLDLGNYQRFSLGLSFEWGKYFAFSKTFALHAAINARWYFWSEGNLNLGLVIGLKKVLKNKQ